MLTAARLREMFHYDHETGTFTRLMQTGNRIRIGDQPKCVARNGYVVFRVEGALHYAHRLAWLYMTGEWPSNKIDHRNGDRVDNRWANLREASDFENAHNLAMRSDNSSGYIGVYLHTSGKWCARIGANKRYRYLGLFDTPAEAHEAYKAAKVKLHPFQPVPRGEAA